MIHQVYGLYDDNKDLEDNKLFYLSHKLWKIISVVNDYEYHLWNKQECDSLINLYPELLDMYNNVKYKIMQCDIIRFLIIYHYGGMYVDLDVLPNKYNYDHINLTEFYMAHYYWTPSFNDKRIIEDIEILYSPPDNILLYNYLLYIKSQIEEKDKIEIYKNWKIRYVFQTSGPASFRRFMKINKMKSNPIKILQLKKGIHWQDYIDISKYGNIEYDCISYHSLSYLYYLYLYLYQT